MDRGTNFLKSKIARRFCILFILCAFLPTVVLLFISYAKVIDQLEEQSIVRLKRESKSYSISLLDRMLRIDNELQTIGRAFINVRDGNHVLEDSHGEFERLFHGIAIKQGDGEYLLVFGAFDSVASNLLITPEMLADPKPFVFTIRKDKDGDVYFGSNIDRKPHPPLTVIALVKNTYLWGVGPEPLLPPMTELSIFDQAGESIMASQNGVTERYQDLRKNHDVSNDDLRVFRYEQGGQIYLASTSNPFLESYFQRAWWTIILSQTQNDIMAAINNFKKIVPLIALLFLVSILYLSIVFIRKGLEPLEQLKAATKLIAEKDFTTKIKIESNDEFQELGDAFNEMSSKLDKQFNTLKVLGEIDRAILSSFERTKVIGTTLQRLKDFFGCDVCLYAKNSSSSTGHIKVYSLKGRRLNDPQIEYFKIEDGAEKNLFADYGQKVMHDSNPLPGFLEKIGYRRPADYLCLPIAIDGATHRTLILGWTKPHLFHEDELHQARKIADQLAIAITNSLHLENLKKFAVGTIEALARTVDAKSKWTSGHSERVSVLGGKIGRTLGLNEKAIDTITRGGLLHDIGKIGIPLAIIDKPSKLTAEEYEEIKHHPVIGAKILEPIEAFQDILLVVVQHHERFDGSGYPNGLKGEEIDIRARILAVADVWDALVSNRPYRQGWIYERAKNFITEGSGTHFDPQVVNAFLSVMDEG